MDSEILDQLTNLDKNVNSEVTKPKSGRKKKADTKINEVEENDVRDKRERLIACALSGNSKQYLGTEYIEQQINEMDSYNIGILSERYESVLSAQMTKSLGKSVINLYPNVACSVLGVGNQQDLSDDLECDPFLKIAMQRFTCDLYYYLKNQLMKNERDNKAIEDLQQAQIEWAEKDKNDWITLIMK